MSTVASARAFFEKLYRRTPQPFRLTLYAAQGKVSRHVLVDSADKLGAAADIAAIVDEKNVDVYYCVAPRGADCDLDIYDRGEKRHAVGLPALFADVDIAGPGHASKSLAPSIEEAIGAALATLPMPSVAVHTGGGAHLYWLLEDPVAFPMGFGPAAQQADQLLKVLGRRLTLAFDPRGWHVDASVCELGRMLRVPGTRNHKIAGQPRPVTVVDDTGPTYTVAQISDLLELPRLTMVAPPTTSTTPTPSPSGPPPAQVPTAVVEVVDGATARASVRAALARVAERGNPRSPIARAILDGAALARPGDRDRALQAAAGLVTFLSPRGAQPEDLLPLLERSLEAQRLEHDDPTNPAPTRDVALEKLRRARRDRERKAAQVDAVGAGLRAAARGANRKPGSEDDEEEPDAFYSPDELAQMVVDNNAGSLTALEKLWVVQAGDSYYALGPAGYMPPIPGTCLDTSLPRDLSPAPIAWQHMNNNGRVVTSTGHDVAVRYGTVARRVLVDLAAARTTYDPATQSIREGVPRRALKPRRDERVDHWLRLLGGEHAEKLLDWVATVGQLEQPSCALYLHGQSSAGKGMLAEGLARLWVVGPPTALGDVMGGSAFNAQLARCPFVFADEELPKGVTADMLRNFVASTSRDLSRKFLPPAELLGAVRLYLASNGDRILAVGDKDLSRAEVEATAIRFLTIAVGVEPVEYLRSIGGRAATNAWVEGDLLARHALWLAENRKVVAGTRFLVEGESSAATEKLASQSRVGGLVAEWIARMVADVAEGRVANGPVSSGWAGVGGGYVLVNVNAVVQFWTAYVRNEDRVPTTARIGKALAGLAGTDSVRAQLPGHPRRRYHVIPARVVIEWAVAHQVTEAAPLAAAISAPAEWAGHVELEEVSGAPH